MLWTRVESPQSTVYFKTAMAEFLDQGQGNRPIMQIDPNVFRCGDTLVIMRYWSKKTLNYLTSAPKTSVIYFIDDDLWARTHNYRPGTLIRMFEDQLRGRVSKIVSPSPQVLSRFPDLPTLRLEPTLIYRLPSSYNRKLVTVERAAYHGDANRRHFSGNKGQAK